jgi:hypothetical protein
MAKHSSGGIFFSKPWRERPWWSKATDVVNVTLTVVILLFIVWDVGNRWLEH